MQIERNRWFEALAIKKSPRRTISAVRVVGDAVEINRDAEIGK